MITIICGLIGAGKTTYAKKNFEAYTDLDEMPSGSKKLDQVKKTIELSKKYKNVAHITTYPTKLEIEELNKNDNEFILLNTTIEQSKENILKRNRVRDISDFDFTCKRNEELKTMFLNSTLNFKRVDVFKNNNVRKEPNKMNEEELSKLKAEMLEKEKLPKGLERWVQGNDAEEIAKDITKLKKQLNIKKPVPPIHVQSEAPFMTEHEEALKETLQYAGVIDWNA